MHWQKISAVLAAAVIGSISASCGAARSEETVAVKKDLYLPNTPKGSATYVSMRYVGVGLEREEQRWTQIEETSPAARAKGVEGRLLDYQWRRSSDNGHTWSAFTQTPPIRSENENAVIWWTPLTYFVDPVTNVTVSMWLRQTQDTKGGCYPQTFARISRDAGLTWSAGTMLRYEDGDDYDPDNPLKKSYLEHNRAYPGNNIIRHSNGTLIHCVAEAANTGDLSSLCFVGRWDPAGEDYRWTPGERVSLKESAGGTPLQEPAVAELCGGRVLAVWRRTAVSIESFHKWFSVSSDGGRTLSPPAEWKYDDGSRFYSSASYHQLLRHTMTGKLYWVGNIVAGPHASGPCQPRFPLVIAEVEETIPAVKKSTVTVIDDRADGESDMIQLSNFSLLEDRESHAIELFMNRLGADPKDFWTGESYKYTLTIDPQPSDTKRTIP